MVRNGIDCVEKYKELFSGRVGLITSVTGLTAEFESTIDILHREFGLTALFSPEHGVRGNIPPGDTVDTYTDPYTGVTAYSLYRKDSKRLTDEMLSQVDCMVYDIQDVGARFYTFMYTMLYALEDCARAGKRFIVLDRLNPIGGSCVEGNLLDPAFASFVGGYPLPTRYGLTIGEFAHMANEQLHLNADLHVVPISGWKREMLFPETGRCWIPPSMNIPTFETALAYIGTCLFEGTNLSEGRGTTMPFQTVGAPFFDGQALSREMNAKSLPGVKFTPAYFTPTTSKFAGEACQGVTLHITDTRALRPAETGLILLTTMFELAEGKAYFLPPAGDEPRQFINLLTGGDFLTDHPLKTQEIIEKYRVESTAFAEQKKQFELYS